MGKAATVAKVMLRNRGHELWRTRCFRDVTPVCCAAHLDVLARICMYSTRAEYVGYSGMHIPGLGVP
jgi:hypothetical protein